MKETGEVHGALARQEEGGQSLLVYALVTSAGVDDPPEDVQQGEGLTSDFSGLSQSCLQPPGE